MVYKCNFLNIFTTLLVFLIERGGHADGSQLPHVRGIPLSKNAVYAPNRDFECLDGSRLMSFDRVNDDYCDCGDGSDEPGTAACPNGVFFCQNTGHISRYLPSSRVNDGVCDCCDASDEWASDAQCLQNCHELGKEARKELEKAAELLKEGSKIRLEMIAIGKRLKTENQANLVKLRHDMEEAVLIRKEKEVTKTLAEERENAALEKYKPVEPQVPAEQPGIEATDYFKMLDSDESGIVTLAEITTRVTFDKDGDGEVTEEEALFFLNNKKEISMEDFVNLAWPLIKPFVMREQGSFKPPTERDEKEEVQEEHDDLPEHPAEADIETGGEFEAPEEEEDEEQEQEPHEKTPEVQYNEETQALIDEATRAREQYQQAEKACSELQMKIRTSEEKNERDYGPEEEFAPLDGECFEYRDSEYVYSMCPFGRATQRSISGGSEVNLGHYHEWAGPETNKYLKMKYDRGLTCWNGPARNVLVNIRCGTENRLVSVSEPSRCEYAMEFITPALCNPDIDRRHFHEEL
ncbi:glucosidase 2 subunit beta [Venturia canescens]|uniref:glucosidase 2 subunit beta n=1 Tax=Venturia canescens TaxID=32260 RepID=UPI001C9CFD9D|nr:glucosidase 2 subunit beta [Venturia canescens]